MIQELLGGSNSILAENRKNSIFEGSTPSSSSSLPSLTPSYNSNSNSNATNSNSNPNPNLNSNNPTSTSVENLRCPRCDSPNTKFCYYNNYNLTQPRHFCKTCRRYWTKGGALRNVPIGGGCRKNKSSITTVSASIGKSNGSTNKFKTMASDIGRSNSFVNGFDHFPSSSPILWASQQSSHLSSLLNASQNPNLESNTFGVKEEGCLIGNLNHLNMAKPDGGLNGRTLGFDPLGHHQVPPLGLCSQIWKTGQQNELNMIGSEGNHNSGIQELYQRLRSSTNNYNFSENSPLVLSNVAGASSTSDSAILDSSPVSALTELSYWNPTFSWPDLHPTTNGAYP